MPRKFSEINAETIYQHIKGGEFTAGEAALKLGWSIQTIKRAAKKYGVTMKQGVHPNASGMTHEQRQEILKALQNGMTRGSASIKFGISRQMIANWIKKARLEIPHERVGKKAGQKLCVMKPAIKVELDPLQREWRAKASSARWFTGLGG